MTTETYKYFQADNVLRPTYGGATILANGDSAELSKETLLHRWISTRLGYPKNGVRYFWEIGTASSVTWIRVPDLHWTSISAELTASELSTVVSTAPTGWTKSSEKAKFQPDPNKFNFFLIGESIPAGLGTSPADTRGTWMARAINGMPGQTLAWTDTNYREGYSRDWVLFNTALGGSSYANVGDSANGATAYPLRQDLAFNQRTATLVVNNRNCLVCSTLLTNDFAYDSSVTSQQGWDRARSWVDLFRARFPNAKLMLNTTGKRTNNAALNARIQGANDLMRANYKSAGVDYLGDVEALVAPLSIANGDTTNTTYFTDTIHWTAALHNLAGDALQPILSKAKSDP